MLLDYPKTHNGIYGVSRGNKEKRSYISCPCYNVALAHCCYIGELVHCMYLTLLHCYTLLLLLATLRSCQLYLGAHAMAF